MQTFSIAFALSFLITLMVIRYSSMHAHITADWDLNGVQKFHARPVPRVGGLGIVLALAAAGVAAFFRDSKGVGVPLALLLGSAAPAFIAGFMADLTKSVSPRGWLIAAMISAIVAPAPTDLNARYASSSLFADRLFVRLASAHCLGA